MTTFTVYYEINRRKPLVEKEYKADGRRRDPVAYALSRVTGFCRACKRQCQAFMVFQDGEDITDHIQWRIDAPKKAKVHHPDLNDLNLEKM